MNQVRMWESESAINVLKALGITYRISDEIVITTFSDFQDACALCVLLKENGVRSRVYQNM